MLSGSLPFSFKGRKKVYRAGKTDRTEMKLLLDAEVLQTSPMLAIFKDILTFFGVAFIIIRH